jgi:transcriptional/translational regulatory protein YebC/TACO1
MGEVGSVNWMFSKKGVFAFDKSRHTEDALMEVGLEAGAEDILDDGDLLEVHCLPADYDALRQAFEQAGMIPESTELAMLPQNTVPVDAETGRKLLRLLEAMEDNEDVQQVHSNVDLPEEVLAEME